ncbi:50S ribosomal protein L5 [Crocosphaera chwakensis CCY0110]|uniref:50S ribosomal protein L5 n=1 Tax=Crocosphaera chwakensis CCY0110 TaxID=391612 RepID=A3IQ15_9CHRO|nr:50S ribosomal protein L5 [Crocosphaera chwakensis CCY0110]
MIGGKLGLGLNSMGAGSVGAGRKAYE